MSRHFFPIQILIMFTHLHEFVNDVIQIDLQVRRESTTWAYNDDFNASPMTMLLFEEYYTIGVKKGNKHKAKNYHEYR